MFCPMCGAKNDSGNRFCNYCGNEFPRKEQPQIEQPRKGQPQIEQPRKGQPRQFRALAPRRPRPLWLLGLLGGLLLAAVVFAAYLLLSGNLFTSRSFPVFYPPAEAGGISQPGTSSPIFKHPEKLQPITPANANQVRQLEQWGEGYVTDAFYSPDGKTVAMLFTTHTEIRDSSNFKILRSLDKTGWTAAFSPDGGTLLIGSNMGELLFWDLQSGSIKQKFETSQPDFFSFSPDGSLIAYTEIDGRTTPSEIFIKVDKSSSGQTVVRLPRSKNYIQPIQFSNDGKMIYASDGTSIDFFDEISGQLIHQETLGYNPLSMTLSPDGRLFALGLRDGSVRLLQTATWQVESSYHINDGIGLLNFSPDGRWLVGSTEKTIHVYDLINRETTELNEHRSPLISLSFSPDGDHLLSCGADGKLLLWDVKNWKIEKVIYQSIMVGPEPVYAKQYDKFLIANPHIPMLIVDGASQKVTTMIPPLNEEYTGPNPLVAANGEAIVYCDGSIKMIRPFIKKEASFNVEGHPCQSVSAISADGSQILFADDNNTWVVYDTQTQKKQYVFQNNSENPPAFSNDLQTLAVPSGGGLVLLDNRNGDQKASIPVFGWRVAFSIDGKYLAGVRDWNDLVVLMDSASGQVIRTFEGSAGSPEVYAFSSDNRLITKPAGDHILVWDTLTGELLTSVPGCTAYYLSFAPDNRWLMSGCSDSTVRFFGIQ